MLEMDIVVTEVGMDRRLDAANAIPDDPTVASHSSQRRFSSTRVLRKHGDGNCERGGDREERGAVCVG